jgi:hypothetical protein
VTQDDEDRQLQSVFRALGAVAQWERLTGGSGPSAPADGSDLAADDASLHPYQMSHAAWAAISAAVSHLGVLRDSLFTRPSPTEVRARLHTHGQAALVRCALETASRAVWLLESDDRQARLVRRLQQEWGESREIEEVRRVMGESAKSKADRFDRLSPLAQQAGVDPAAIKERAEYTTIVSAASQHIDIDPAVTVVIWKACSSLAHGEARGQIAYLTKEILGEASPDVAQVQVTGNLLLLTTGVHAAVGITKTAFDLYAKRSGVPTARSRRDRACNQKAPRQP